MKIVTIVGARPEAIAHAVQRAKPGQPISDYGKGASASRILQCLSLRCLADPIRR